MTDQELVNRIIKFTGGMENIVSAANCMTRLRITVRNDNLINEAQLKNTEGVLGIIHDRKDYIEVVVGPGKSRKCADLCAAMGITASAQADWKENKQFMVSARKSNTFRDSMKIFGEIFVPLIPGVIAAGLCAGINSLITQSIPGWEDNTILSVLSNMLSLIQTSFMTYITAWCGYRAAERFGGTPVLGGMLGMITGLDGVNEIAMKIGWFNETSPLDSILRSGRGGVLAVVLGVLLMVEVEKRIRRKMPDSLDIVFTPVLTLLICVTVYVFIIMPLCGLVSTGICTVLQSICMSENIIVRIIAGYVSSALFLPMVAMGMHHGLVALYAVQLNQLGYVTLYPALCMAGAGQVGAALNIWKKTRKVRNERLSSIIRGALPAGILGIGEPLIYGVTLPMGRPFITAGFGAGFGGAFVMAMQVAATTWGPSGVLGAFVMTAGPGGALRSAAFYLCGLVIAALAAYVITDFTLGDELVQIL